MQAAEEVLPVLGGEGQVGDLVEQLLLRFLGLDRRDVRGGPGDPEDVPPGVADRRSPGAKPADRAVGAADPVLQLQGLRPPLDQVLEGLPPPRPVLREDERLEGLLVPGQRLRVDPQELRPPGGVVALSFDRIVLEDRVVSAPEGPLVSGLALRQVPEGLLPRRQGLLPLGQGGLKLPGRLGHPEPQCPVPEQGRREEDQPGGGEEQKQRQEAPGQGGVLPPLPVQEDPFPDGGVDGPEALLDPGDQVRPVPEDRPVQLPPVERLGLADPALKPRLVEVVEGRGLVHEEDLDLPPGEGPDHLVERGVGADGEDPVGVEVGLRVVPLHDAHGEPLQAAGVGGEAPEVPVEEDRRGHLRVGGGEGEAPLPLGGAEADLQHVRPSPLDGLHRLGPGKGEKAHGDAGPAAPLPPEVRDDPDQTARLVPEGIGGVGGVAGHAKSAPQGHRRGRGGVASPLAEGADLSRGGGRPETEKTFPGKNRPRLPDGGEERQQETRQEGEQGEEGQGREAGGPDRAEAPRGIPVQSHGGPRILPPEKFEADRPARPTDRNGGRSLRPAIVARGRIRCESSPKPPEGGHGDPRAPGRADRLRRADPGRGRRRAMTDRLRRARGPDRLPVAPVQQFLHLVQGPLEEPDRLLDGLGGGHVHPRLLQEGDGGVRAAPGEQGQGALPGAGLPL